MQQYLHSLIKHYSDSRKLSIYWVLFLSEDENTFGALQVWIAGRQSLNKEQCVLRVSPGATLRLIDVFSTIKLHGTGGEEELGFDTQCPFVGYTDGWWRPDWALDQLTVHYRFLPLFSQPPPPPIRDQYWSAWPRGSKWALLCFNTTVTSEPWPLPPPRPSVTTPPPTSSTPHLHTTSRCCYGDDLRPLTPPTSVIN